MSKRANGEGTVFYDKSRGRWVGQAFVHGKRRKIVARTKTDAAARLATLRSEPPPRPSGTMTVSELLEDWLRRDVKTRNLAPSTIARHEWAKGYLTDHLGPTRANDLSVPDVEQMADKLATTLSRASVAKVLSSLSSALTFGQRREVVDRNVARLVRPPLDARPPVPRRSLTPAEARKLLFALQDERNGALFALMLTIGLRPGEAMGLYWSDLDLEAGNVNVTRGLQIDQRGAAAVVDELKTITAKRTLGLPADTLALLATHRRQQAAERLRASSWDDERLAFASPRGAVLSPTYVRSQLDEICTRVGISRVRPNELRHSCASLLSDRGVPIELIADVLGHTSTRMVDATYRHRIRPVVDITAGIDWQTIEGQAP